MAALGSMTPERQHMNKAYSHNDHHWGITVTIKRCYHVKHLYYRSDRTCFNFFLKIVVLCIWHCVDWYVQGATPKCPKLECCAKTACSTVVRRWESRAVSFANHSAKRCSVLCTSPITYTCHMPLLSHLSCFHHVSNVSCRFQIIILLVM
jgi:hypothetical protein